jgi:carboxyl-terminal processing protease
MEGVGLAHLYPALAWSVCAPGLIGPRTEGAVLAATAFLIGSGLLLLAVEDVRVDGERLEGVGVTPTIEVQAGAASAGSDDAQLSRAVAVLSGT